MTIREIRKNIATFNGATYSIRSMGSGIVYKDLHYDEIPRDIKDATIFHATPTDVSFHSVKHWLITIL